jgi:hypothetical protein
VGDQPKRREGRVPRDVPKEERLRINEFMLKN